MCSLIPKILRVSLVILIGLLKISNSVTYAQNSSLQQCGENFLKARQALDDKKPANQLGLTDLFDPDAAKHQQISKNGLNAFEESLSPL